MDEDIKKLFDDFNPELPPADDFMERLMRNMDSVELIRQRAVENARRSRRTAVIAAFAGFAAGIAFCLIAPYLVRVLLSMTVKIPLATDIIESPAFVWLTIAAATTFSALGTYSFLSRLSSGR